MSRKARKCYLCGESYQYCGSCSDDRMKPAWMAEFHSESCKNIFDICTRFNMQLMSKTEAQEALKKCDLSNKANFKSFVQRDLEKIFAEDKITVNVDAKIKEITKDEVVVEAAPVPALEQAPVLEPAVRIKRKSKSHEVVNKTEE